MSDLQELLRLLNSMDASFELMNNNRMCLCVMVDCDADGTSEAKFVTTSRPTLDINEHDVWMVL